MDQPFPIDLPPGVYANGTEYQTKGRWLQADLIRWYEGRIRPIGGWVRFTGTPLPEPARGLHAWRRNDGSPFAAFGTASHLYETGGATNNDITPTGLLAGNVDALLGGYGSGNYSGGNYGQSTSTAPIADATTWDLDSFGQILLAVSSTDGKLYQWDASTQPPKATAVAPSGSTAVPTGNVGMFVTDDRICVLLGSGGNPREVSWSNQGDYTMWDVTQATTAGDLQLKTNGRILSACKMLGTNLIWTDADVHTFTYVGYPYIYGSQRVGSNCGLIARKAFAATANMAVWMGNQTFYMYNGVVQELPCDVRKAVFDNLNTNQQSKVCCGVNSLYSEIWWFFPSLASNECDSYVYWNYKDKHWGLGLGVLGRTAWLDKEVWPLPLACGADYNMYEHESGWLAAGLSRNASVKAVSGPIDLNNGLRIFEANQMLYDASVPKDGSDSGALTLSILTKYTPNGAETTWGPYALRTDGSGYTDARFNGRQFKLSLAQTTDGLWQWGNLRVMGGPTGGQR